MVTGSWLTLSFLLPLQQLLLAIVLSKVALPVLHFVPQPVWLATTPHSTALTPMFRPMLAPHTQTEYEKVLVQLQAFEKALTQRNNSLSILEKSISEVSLLSPLA